MRHFLVTFVLLFYQTLYADITLQKNYLVEHNYILLSDITKNSPKNIKLFTIESNKHSKRIKTSELSKILKKFGYTTLPSKHNYTQFTQKSPINMARIEKFIEEKYHDYYSQITIFSVNVVPRSFTTTLPSEYTLSISKKAMLKSIGVVALRTPENKKTFFNYHVKAKVPLLVTKIVLKKGDELSRLNVKKKSIMLNKFKSIPLQELKPSTYEAKHKIKKGTLITERDVLGLYLIKRGAHVNVTINDTNMAITFGAKAHTSGRFGETVILIGANKKRVKAVVTGRNRAEMK